MPPWVTIRMPSGTDRTVRARPLMPIGNALMVAMGGRWVTVPATDVLGECPPPAWALDIREGPEPETEPMGDPADPAPGPVHDAYTGARLDLAFAVAPGDVVAITDAERRGTTLIHVEHADRYTVVGHQLGGRQIIVPASLVLRPATIAEAAVERPGPATASPAPVVSTPKPQPRRAEPARPTGQLSLF